MEFKVAYKREKPYIASGLTVIEADSEDEAKHIFETGHTNCEIVTIEKVEES